jgi:hypothetical protein
VPLVENDEPVKAFLANRTDPTLGKGVGFRRAYRCFDGVDPLGFEDGVEVQACTCYRDRGSGSVPDTLTPQAARERFVLAD